MNEASSVPVPRCPTLLEFFSNAVIQRCLVHNERNIRAKLSKRHWGEMARLFKRLRSVQGAIAALGPPQVSVPRLEANLRGRIGRDFRNQFRKGSTRACPQVSPKCPKCLSPLLPALRWVSQVSVSRVSHPSVCLSRKVGADLPSRFHNAGDRATITVTVSSAFALWGKGCLLTCGMATNIDSSSANFTVALTTSSCIFGT
jgi:hypothetical protein